MHVVFLWGPLGRVAAPGETFRAFAAEGDCVGYLFCPGPLMHLYVGIDGDSASLNHWVLHAWGPGSVDCFPFGCGVGGEFLPGVGEGELCSLGEGVGDR